MKPTQNEKFLADVRELNCIACGKMCPSDPHHLKSVGSGGGDDPWNVIPLCRLCHTSWHTIGASLFLRKFPRVELHLKSKGWYWTHDGKLRNIHYDKV